MSIYLFWQSIFDIDTTPRRSQSLNFLEAQGRVTEPIAPNDVGRIQLQGVSWLARCTDTLLHPLPINTPVQVVGRVGLTVLIRPVAVAVHPPNKEAFSTNYLVPINVPKTAA